MQRFTFLPPSTIIYRFDYTTLSLHLPQKYRHSNRHAPHFLPFQQLLNLLFLPFQVILLLRQIIALFAEFFHALQLRPHSLSAIRLYLLIFPGQITDCTIVRLDLLRQHTQSIRFWTSLSVSYHVLFIHFVRTPNSFLAFSSVRFDISCLPARLKISLLCMALFVSGSSRSNRFTCYILFAFGATPPNTSSAIIS